MSAEDNATQDGSQAAGLLTFGESIGLIRTPDVGFARLFRYSIGGAESNVAIGAARLGAPATWLGRLGTDATGDLIERRLRAEGVRVRAIRDGGWTGIMLRHRRFAGHVEIDYHRAGSAASLLRPADIPDELLSRAWIVHVMLISPRGVAHFAGCLHKGGDLDYTKWATLRLPRAWERLGNGEILPATGGQRPNLVAKTRCKDCVSHGS